MDAQSTDPPRAGDADVRRDHFSRDHAALLDYSRTLNHVLQAHKVTESERAFLVSGVLLALHSPEFAATWRAQPNAQQLAASLSATLHQAFAALPPAHQDELTQTFVLPRSPALQDHEFLRSLIDGINRHVADFHRTHKYHDTIGQFYVEFLRYANNDKGLGIVLTPHHIAELLAELTAVDADSVVFDNCCGTGGLLIAAMQRMTRAGPHRGQLIGIEFQSRVYALAAANMLLHGESPTQILRGDCFTVTPTLATRPTVGLLNPPYRNKQSKGDREELEYILNNLAALRPGSPCAAIVPITCATAPDGTISGIKHKLLNAHTLEAVMSLPLDLFVNSRTTVVTCIMVFTAHQPHPPGKHTWFGYWRDDGLIKTKHRGRIDARDEWSRVRTAWISAFRERAVVPGSSVTRIVDHTDEWVAEAYLPTDYSTIDEPGFLHAMKRHLLARVVDP